LWLFANLMYGFILNLAPLVLGALLAGQLSGAVLRWIYPGLGSDDIELSALPWVGVTVGLLVALSVLTVGLRRFSDKDRSRPRLGRRRSERLVALFLTSALVVTALCLFIPALLQVLSVVGRGHIAPHLERSDTSYVVRRAVAGAVTLFVTAILGAAAVWLLRRRKWPAIRGIFAAISGAGVLFIPFIVAADTTVSRGWRIRTDGFGCALALAGLIIFAIFAHNRRYSMHLFYRERLQSAFASRRVSRNDKVDLEDVPYEESIRLSDVAAINARRAAKGGYRVPELIMCAAVAARGAEVPSKTWASSFTFEGQVSGNLRLKLSAPTRELEAGDWIGGGGLTLPAIMAISGAAVSPLMGRFTLPAFRFLMAVMNLRLGVWIRNPSRPKEEKTGHGHVRRAWRYVVRGWREPGAWYVLKEGLGLVSTKGRFIYVSDGGHWENLGLTELLRRECTHVVLFDASSAGLGGIGQAMAIARAELGVEFDFDPRPTSPGDGDLAESPVAVGSFRYRDGREGDIFFARSELWPEAPADLQLLAAHESQFPHHSTSRQLLPGKLFDAYKALGYAVADKLLGEIRLPPTDFDEAREGWDTDVQTEQPVSGEV